MIEIMRQFALLFVAVSGVVFSVVIMATSGETLLQVSMAIVVVATLFGLYKEDWETI